MHPQDLIPLLQLSDTSFPAGGFACSWGMEALVQGGFVHDRRSAQAALAQELLGSVGAVELPAVARARRCLQRGDVEALEHLNALLDGYAPAAASREASRRMGRRMLQAALVRFPQLRPALDTLADAPGGLHHAVAFGAAGGALALPGLAAVTAYATTWCTQLLLAAARLIPLGQTDVLAAQATLQAPLSAAVQRAERGQVGRYPSATPLASVARLLQPWLERRLFVC